MYITFSEIHCLRANLYFKWDSLKYKQLYPFVNETDSPKGTKLS